MIGAENLLEKDPEGHERREDPILPGSLYVFQREGDGFGRQDISEWQSALLEDLLSEEVNLPRETSLQFRSHGTGL